MADCVVGWCEQDLHVACVTLHVRACRSCRPYNEGFINWQDARSKQSAA